MRFSAASLLLGGCLLLSLVGKVAANRTVAPPDYRFFDAKMSAFLREDGYETATRWRPLGPVIYGRKAGCRIMIADYTPYGTFAEVLARRAAPVGPMRFIYRGRTYGEAPKLVPLSEFYVQREMRRIGMTVPRAPILAIAAAPACDLRPLDWARFATLPR